MTGEQRQQSVRRRRGDDFNEIFVLKLFEGADEVAVVMPPRFAREGKFVVIHPRKVAEGAVPVRAMNFFFGEFDEAVEMFFITPPEQIVLQHRAECGRK